MNDYNRIYEKLVSNKNDYIGMVAYSIYKGEKRAIVKKGENIDAFMLLKSKTHELERYKKEATDLINNFSQSVIDEEFDRLRKNISENIAKIKINHIPDNESPYIKFGKWFLFSGTEGVIGNVFTTLLIVLFFFIFSDSISSAKDMLVDLLAKSLSELK